MGRMTMRVGELARRTGVSVRTLHYYEEIGLLPPAARSESGYRLYGPDQIARLQQIISLRELGFSLAHINDFLSQPGASPLEAVEMHLTQLRQRMEAERHLCGRLEALANHLRMAEGVTVDEFLETIKEMVRVDKYYTPEQMEELRQRGEALGEAGLRRAEQDWATLIDEVKAEMAKGTDPTDERVQALARRWMSLVEAFTGGNPEIAQSLNRMWQDEEEIHGINTAEMREMGEYIGRALAAARGE